MQVPLKQPQEIEVWYVLPAIRKALVYALKEKNLSQKEIARLLNITESAVSQYLSAKRAGGIIFSPDIASFIQKAAEQIVDNASAYQQIQRISSHIRETKAICRIHMDMEKGLQGCDICYR